jgi:RimJ/RimL family protein N-acetyltransferase
MLRTTDPFRCGEATGRPLEVYRDGDRLSVVSEGRVGLRLRLQEGATPHLSLEEPVKPDPRDVLPGVTAAFEMVSATHPEAGWIGLDPASFAGLAAPLMERGLAVREGDGLGVDPVMLWQRPEPWLAQLAARDFPARPVMSGGKRHPQRPPKPEGTIYSRFIPWLGQAVAFRAATLDDVDTLHRWFNDPVVDAAWGEAGARDRHETYLAGLIADPHMIPLIGTIGGEPFGYFEIYWAKENRLAPFYDVQDYDRGWHVLIGESRFRGKAYISAWLPSLMHALFLDDPRTERIVGEPKADHVQQLRNLERSGFARIKTFDFPHKRAALVMLLRERFFGERLWSPAGGLPASPETGSQPAP